MSYIFEALKKNHQAETTKSQKGDSIEQSLVSSAHHATNSPRELHSHGQLAFSWGLLLALAILGSVILGFFLGRLSVNVTPTTPSSIINKPSNNVVATDVKSQSPASVVVNDLAVPQKQPSQTTNIKKLPINKEPVKQIAAEKYFDNPSLANTALNKELSTTTQEAMTANQLSSKAEAKPEQPTEFKVSQVDGVSDKLMSLFEEAIAETSEEDVEGELSNSSQPTNQQEQTLLDLSQMPQWVQEAVPSLSFNLHMYSSNTEQSWLRVNGEDKYAGEFIGQDLLIRSIEPQLVVLEYQGNIFTLPALSQW